MMQRRRRLEEDVALRDSLRRRSDDLAVLVDWAGQGEDVAADLERGLNELECGGRGRRGPEDAGRRVRQLQRHRVDPPRRRRHRVPGLGRDAAQDVPQVVGAARLQARGHRLPARRRSRPQERHADLCRRLRVRPDVGRSRRAPAGAHLPVRSGGPPPHVVRLGVRLARAARRRRGGDRREGPARGHLPIERRRRPARERHRLGDPHHAPAHRHRRVVPERAVPAQEPRLGDEGAARRGCSI